MPRHESEHEIGAKNDEARYACRDQYYDTGSGRVGSARAGTPGHGGSLTN
jgi:hypothetical protein